MCRGKRLGCVLLVLLAAAMTLPAAENENIVSRTGGKAAWTHSGTIVPAVVLLRPAQDGKILVTVNDPEQDPKRESVTLGWNGKKYRIQLPTGAYCGQPVTVDLSKFEPQKEEAF